MYKTHFIFIFLISYNFYSQETKEMFLQNNKSLEKVSFYNPNFKVSFNDTRTFEQNKINMESFETNLRGFHELFENVLISPELSQLKNKEININVNFYHFIESSTKNTIIKGSTNIEIKGGSYSDLNTEFNLSAEDFTSFKFKNIHKAKHPKTIKLLIENFSKKYAKNIVKKILEKTKDEAHYIFEIVSIGTAKMNETLNKKETLKRAKLNALINASESAFGLQVSNISKIEDFGDVSDVLKSETGATVLSHKVIENSVVYTIDNYCCLVIKSIIKKKQKI
jgi:hypothetical protein